LQGNSTTGRAGQQRQTLSPPQGKHAQNIPKPPTEAAFLILHPVTQPSPTAGSEGKVAALLMGLMHLRQSAHW